MGLSGRSAFLQMENSTAPGVKMAPSSYGRHAKNRMAYGDRWNRIEAKKKGSKSMDICYNSIPKKKNSIEKRKLI